MLVNPEKFKTYLVFSAYFRRIFSRVWSNLIDNDSFSMLSFNQINSLTISWISYFCPPKCLLQSDFGFSIFPSPSLSKIYFSFNFRPTSLPSFKGYPVLIPSAHFLPPHHTLYVLLEDLIINCDHMHSPSINSNT